MDQEDFDSGNATVEDTVGNNESGGTCVQPVNFVLNNESYLDDSLLGVKSGSDDVNNMAAAAGVNDNADVDDDESNSIMDFDITRNDSDDDEEDEEMEEEDAVDDDDQDYDLDEDGDIDDDVGEDVVDGSTSLVYPVGPLEQNLLVEAALDSAVANQITENGTEGDTGIDGEVGQCDDDDDDDDEQPIPVVNRHNVLSKRLIDIECKYCNESFISKSLLRRHRKQVHSKAARNRRINVNCSVCGKNFNRAEKLARHELTHERQKIRKEARALISAGNQEAATKLLESHGLKPISQHKIIDVECPQCGRHFKRKDHLQRHLETHARQEARSRGVRPLDGDFVGFDETDAADDASFRRAPRVRKLVDVTCDECGKHFHRMDHLNRHKQTVHAEERPHVCTVCPKAFARLEGLKRHIEKHKHPCDRCPKMYSTPEALEKHKLRHLFKCEFCHGYHQTKEELKQHLVIHQHEMPNTCDICGKSFHFKKQLTNHRDIHKSEDPNFVPFTCELCGAQCKTKKLLDRHLIGHSGRRDYMCTICGKAFKLRVDLTKHNIIHFGTRKHKCDICGKGFYQNKDLKRHMSIHGTDTPFRCSICNKGFKVRYNYTMHLYTHAGKHPFQCKMCSQHFRSGVKLKAHMVEMHPEVRDLVAKAGEDVMGVQHKIPTPMLGPVDHAAAAAGAEQGRNEALLDAAAHSVTSNDAPLYDHSLTRMMAGGDTDPNYGTLNPAFITNPYTGQPLGAFDGQAGLPMQDVKLPHEQLQTLGGAMYGSGVAGVGQGDYRSMVQRAHEMSTSGTNVLTAREQQSIVYSQRVWDWSELEESKKRHRELAKQRKLQEKQQQKVAAGGAAGKKQSARSYSQPTTAASLPFSNKLDEIKSISNDYAMFADDDGDADDGFGASGQSTTTPLPSIKQEVIERSAGASASLNSSKPSAQAKGTKMKNQTNGDFEQLVMKLTGNHEYDTKCPLCDKRLSRIDHLKEHVRKKHQRHLVVDRGETSKNRHEKSIYRSRECHVCGRNFRRPDHLRRHLRVIHKEDVPRVRPGPAVSTMRAIEVRDVMENASFVLMSVGAVADATSMSASDESVERKKVENIAVSAGTETVKNTSATGSDIEEVITTFASKDGRSMEVQESTKRPVTSCQVRDTVDIANSCDKLALRQKLYKSEAANDDKLATDAHDSANDVSATSDTAAKLAESQSSVDRELDAKQEVNPSIATSGNVSDTSGTVADTSGDISVISKNTTIISTDSVMTSGDADVTDQLAVSQADVSVAVNQVGDADIVAAAIDSALDAGVTAKAVTADGEPMDDDVSEGNDIDAGEDEDVGNDGDNMDSVEVNVDYKVVEAPIEESTVNMDTIDNGQTNHDYVASKEIFDHDADSMDDVMPPLEPLPESLLTRKADVIKAELSTQEQAASPAADAITAPVATGEEASGDVMSARPTDQLLEGLTMNSIDSSALDTVLDPALELPEPEVTSDGVPLTREIKREVMDEPEVDELKKQSDMNFALVDKLTSEMQQSYDADTDTEPLPEEEDVMETKPKLKFKYRRSKSSRRDKACMICSKLFTRSEHVRRHMRLVHKVNVALTKKEPAPNPALKPMILKIKGERTPTDIRCPVCNQEMARMRALLKHCERVHYLAITLEKPAKQQSPTVVSSTPNGEKRFQCPVCAKQFKRKDHLSRHAYVHTGLKPFQCDRCPLAFTRKEYLDNHLQTHTPKCELCGVVFDGKDSYRHHLLSAHENEAPNVCDQCGETFLLKAQLRNHIKQHHIETANKSYSCEICGQSFRQKRLLERHHVGHTGKRDFVCQVCGKAFKMKVDLYKHSIYHSGKKNFQCPKCPLAFFQSKDLRRHLFNHGDVRPFQCDMCDRAFKNRQNLKVHKYTHTGEKPNQCHICTQAFRSGVKLDAHMQFEHNIAPTVNSADGAPPTTSLDVRLELAVRRPKQTRPRESKPKFRSSSAKAAAAALAAATQSSSYDPLHISQTFKDESSSSGMMMTSPQLPQAVTHPQFVYNQPLQLTSQAANTNTTFTAPQMITPSGAHTPTPTQNMRLPTLNTMENITPVASPQPVALSGYDSNHLLATAQNLIQQQIMQGNGANATIPEGMFSAIQRALFKVDRNASSIQSSQPQQLTPITSPRLVATTPTQPAPAQSPLALTMQNSSLQSSLQQQQQQQHPLSLRTTGHVQQQHAVAQRSSTSNNVLVQQQLSTPTMAFNLTDQNRIVSSQTGDFYQDGVGYMTAQQARLLYGSNLDVIQQFQSK